MYVTKYLLVFILSALFVIIYTSCDQVEQTDSSFDANLINQHLVTDVSFTEQYRPQFHYTPRINWMNDPNGLVYYEGKYHLFHQYNPFGNRWGYMSWNHAVSEDLVHWQHKPVAIPYGKKEEEAIFSGSAVVDHNNTSGFGNGQRVPLVAIYTSHYTREDGSTWQAQSLAYSIDGGESFVKYEGNPVLKYDDPDFRDPNVIWIDKTGQWVMVVALPRQHKVQFYASDNLIDWEFLSDFGPDGAIDGIWECPDLFPVAVDGDSQNTRWILHVDINPGAIAGGSGSQFFVGDWDGRQFIPDETISGGDVIWADYGTDFYAAITWNNIPEEDGRRIWVGWMNNWMYANIIPTSPWRSAQSIPRSIHLETVDGNIKVIQRPVEELHALRSEHRRIEDIAVSGGTHSLSEYGIYGKSYEIIAELSIGDAQDFGFEVRKGGNEKTRIGYNSQREVLYVDRTQSGEVDFHDGFASVSEAPMKLKDGKLILQIFVDWSSVEVFAQNGTTILTKRIFPGPESEELMLYSEGGESSLIRLDFWNLKSIWN